MFAVRNAPIFGLAIALCFLTAGYNGMGTAQDKKEEKKKVISKIKITVPQENAQLTIEKDGNGNAQGSLCCPGIPNTRTGSRQEIRILLLSVLGTE